MILLVYMIILIWDYIVGFIGAGNGTGGGEATGDGLEEGGDQGSGGGLVLSGGYDGHECPVVFVRDRDDLMDHQIIDLFSLFR